MKKLKKHLLVFLLAMAMCCPLLLEPLSVLADGNNNFSAEAQVSCVKVERGQNAFLRVIATADDMTKVTYQWYKVVRETGNQGTEVTRQAIIGATQSTYVTDAIENHEDYRCLVENGYGSYYDVGFTVDIDNHLVAEAVEWKVLVTKGSNAELEVKVSADDMTGITYEWIDGSYNVLEETTNKLQVKNITDFGQYQCVVTDRYGWTEYVSFEVSIDNHLNATSVKETILVAKGGDAELEVSASADDLSGVEYEWFRTWWEELADGSSSWEEELIEGETAKKLILRNVTKADSYQCRVTDRYNTTKYVSFRVGIENHLEVMVGKRDYSVTFGAPLDVKAVVSADDMSQLSFQWYEMKEMYDSNGMRYNQEIKIDGATSITYHLDSVTEAKCLNCRVEDRYGNQQQTGPINIKLSNRFQARGLIQKTEYQAGESATLKVEVSADDMTGIKYEWRRCRSGYGDTDETEQVLDANGTDTFVTGPITESWVYKCKVTDNYGDEETVSFSVNVENHMRVSKHTDLGVELTPGTKTRLEMKVRADDMDGITYYWKLLYDKDTYWNKTLSVGKNHFIEVQECGQYECCAVDAYGRVISQQISVHEPRVNSWIVGDESVVIPTGGSTTLQVATDAANPAEVEYEWYYSVPGLNEFGYESSYWTKLDCKEASLQVTEDMEAGEYNCSVHQEGRWDYHYFHVYRDVKSEVLLTPSKGTINEDGVLWISAGETVTLTATSTGFGSGLVYHWIENDFGGGMIDINESWYLINENTNTLTVTAPPNGMTYDYCCYVSDEQGHFETFWVSVKTKDDCNVTFKANGGSGSMAKKVAQKYYEFTLPKCTFTAPEGKVFAGWDINGEIYEEDETIIPEGNVSVKATWKDEPTDSSLAISDVNVVLQNNLALQFFSSKSLYTQNGYDAPFIVFNVNGKEKTVQATEDGTNYVFICNNIAPQMIGDRIGFTIYAMKDGIRVKGMSAAYSVKDYCDYVLQNMSSDVKLRTLIVDLLNYGAATQTYANYKTDALVNKDLTTTQQGWATDEREYVNSAALTNVDAADLAGVSITNMSLVLNETVAIRYFFTADSISGLTLEIKDDKEQTWTFSESDFVKGSDNNYHVDFRKLQACRMSDVVYATFHKGSQKSYTAVYSIESYASIIPQYTTDQKLLNLISCMMKYGDAAKAYKNQ